MPFEARAYDVPSLTECDTRVGVGISVNNKGSISSATGLHPDIYPSRLIRRALAYLEDQQGTPLERFASFWCNEGAMTDNYHQFQANKAAYGSHPTPEQTHQAAKDTWAGKMAGSLGFTTVGSMCSYAGIVQVMFDRPRQ